MIITLISERGLSSGNTAPYPMWYGEAIPVKVIAEYPNFYVVEVQEHTNSHTIFPNNPFTPYKVTIDKFDLERNVFQWKEAV